MGRGGDDDMTKMKNKNRNKLKSENHGYEKLIPKKEIIFPNGSLVSIFLQLETFKECEKSLQCNKCRFVIKVPTRVLSSIWFYVFF